MDTPSNAPLAPDWAIEQASTALQSGMSAAEAEQRLVVTGLDAQVAHGAVSRALSKPAAAPPMLEWAMEHVRASLKTGVSVPEIERRLVAKGVTPEVAEAVITRILGERVRAGQPDTPGQRRWRILHRIASSVVACSTIILVSRFGSSYLAFRTIPGVVFPVFFIWFGDTIGPVWARIGGGGPLPGFAVRWLGWIILVPIFLCVLVFVAYKL